MNYKKLALILFLVFVLSLLPSVSSADWWDEWRSGDSKGSALSNYYQEEGIKFYRIGRYKKAEQAFKKALLIDPDCEIARRYLRKICSPLQTRRSTPEEQKTYPIAHRKDRREGREFRRRRKGLEPEIRKEEKISEEIKKIEEEIEGWEEYVPQVPPKDLEGPRRTSKDLEGPRRTPKDKPTGQASLRGRQAYGAGKPTGQARHTLHAARVPREPLNLGKVVVTATKTEREIKDIPASVSLISKEDIEEIPADYADDILRNSAGIGIDRGKGGLSSLSSFIYIRGFSQPRAVVLMRDGVPINRAVCGGTLFNEVPIGTVEKIEVVRGASSSLYGSGAMGGVVNIFTKEPTEETKVTIDNSYGTHNTYKSSTTLSGPLGEDLGYVLSYGHLKTDGFVAFDGMHKERAGEIAAVTKMRKAAIPNYRTADNTFAKLVYKLDPFSSFSLSHSFWKDDIGQGRKFFHTDVERNRTILGYRNKGLDLDVSANLFYLNEKIVHYLDNALWPSASQPFEELAQIRYKPGKDTGGNLTFSFPLSENQVLTTGLDYRWAEMEDKLNTFGPPAKKGEEKAVGRQHNASLFFEDEINLGEVGPGELSLNLSGRADWYRTYGGYHHKKQWNPKQKKYIITEDSYSAKTSGAFNPKLGAVYHLSDSTTLRASVGRAFHMPYLYSLYGTTECPPGKINEGNPDLKPEYVIGYELGLDQRIGENLVLRLTGFYNDIHDWMDKSYLTKNTNKWSNIDEVRTAGLEIEGEYNLFDDLTLFANYNYLYTEIDKYSNPPCAAKKGTYEGKRLSDQPEHRTNFGLTYAPESLTFSLRCRYVGSRYDDLENTKKLEEYLTADLLISKKIREFIEVALEINDLFNESWHDDADWLASPGRTYIGKVRMVF